MQDVFIIGSKGIPAAYGGFETFVENLVTHQKNENIKYHVACMSNEVGECEYYGAHCFRIKVPNLGAAKAIYYDIVAFKYCIDYIEKNKVQNPVVYVLACRIGPWIHKLKTKLEKLGGKLLVNPDGHEWLRAKWNYFIKKYWKFSESLMVKQADLCVCDSKNIQSYIKTEYKKYRPHTIYISYGADVNEALYNKSKLDNWYKKFDIEANKYYLVVGRFVPENNYELIIKEFLKTNTENKLVIITNVEKNKFYNNLKKTTGFINDKRIKFVGTVYDKELLFSIRKDAIAYIHGHSVGGTNPSLLEALATTNVNILYDVGFNYEVAEDAALYFTSENGSLKECIEKTDKLQIENKLLLGVMAKDRINKMFSHELIVCRYEKLFTKAGMLL